MGRWVIRTPLSVLFWCWPPGPPERMTSISRSSVRISISTSSGSGRTATVAAEVWMRPWVSVCGDALDAMAAAFELEVAERPLAVEAERDLPEPAEFGGFHVEDLELPAHRLGEAAVHLVQVAGEQGRLVAPRAGPDLDDHRRVIGARLAVVEEVAEGLGVGLLALAEDRQLALGVRPHLGVGLGVEQGLGLLDLPAEVEVAAVQDRQLGERPRSFEQRGDPRDVGRDGRVEQGLLDFEEPLIVRLELLEHVSNPRPHGRAIRERASRTSRARSAEAKGNGPAGPS